MPNHNCHKESANELVVKIATTPEEIAKVEATEDWVFELSGYGLMDRKYRHQARNFGAFNPKGVCVASLRILRYDTPALAHFDFSDKSVSWRSFAEAGTFEEVGSVAVLPEWQRPSVGLGLYKEAYRDAKHRGVLWWTAIMEPRRIAILNRKFHFTFRRAGNVAYYMGGNCAPHVMAMADVERNMRDKNPELFRWFTEDLSLAEPQI